MFSRRAAWIWPAEIPLRSGTYRKFGRGTNKRQAKAMKRQLPAAVNMIAELVFIVSVMLIIFGAFFGMFGSHPSLAVISVIVFCLSLFSWAYFQDT
jgi:magnesium-transporting ATPase (P-type)